MQTFTRIVNDFIATELKFYQFGEGKPQLFITGGIHGGEATGIYVAQKLVKYLQTNEVLKGSVKILPISNPLAFRRMERTSPYDELDMNRIFPGTTDSSPTRAIANIIWEEAKEASYIVDLHCCGLSGSSYTLALWQDYSFAKDLAAMLAIPRIIQSGGTRGQLFTDATDLGIPAVIIELPGGQPNGTIDLEAAEECYNAMLNLLRQLEMLKGDPFKPEPVFYGKIEPIMPGLEGTFIPVLKPGSKVKKDEPIGHVDEKPILAPYDGVAIMVRPASFIFKGVPVANIAPLIK